MTDRYRKKPVEVEAMQWTGGADVASHVIDWIIANGGTARYVGYESGWPEHINVDTLEGTMHADVGDWIIRGVKDEHYPCKPDIFAATYEPVSDA